MNPVNPKKLRHSKWTAVQPTDKQKHFLVTEVLLDDEGVPQRCIMEAVYTGAEQTIHWRDLKDTARWQIGWQ